uniref:Rho guanine nucleotide exchange factor 49 n=1 Tax=Oncorhynchus tshawytscha TaxID=74940 RepID=A0AAZ3SPD2_ONCTS
MKLNDMNGWRREVPGIIIPSSPVLSSPTPHVIPPLSLPLSLSLSLSFSLALSVPFFLSLPLSFSLSLSPSFYLSLLSLSLSLTPLPLPHPSVSSCSAEIAAAEAPIRLSGDQDDSANIAPPPDFQSSTVSMTTTTACGEEACDKPAAGGGEELTAECQHSGLGCRRSSSDAAYEPAESVRAQRECRLRPHYSDPMPADAAKRKQLEMKIAAAARLHSQRRDRDSAPASVRVRSEPRGEERLGSLGVTRGGQHRWSTVSSLSADSGVVGLCDDRDDDDEPRRVHHSGGAEVERVDSGIGPCLARVWKRPSASLRAWEAQRPCPDCGQRDGHGVARTEGEGTGMCERCSKLRTERKEAILEFLNTESSYGEDLRIIKEEFYCPMQSAGLLTSEQLTVVFSNVQELIDVNERFTEHLQESIDQAFDQGDEDLLTVCIGEMFLEFVNMLPAFQTYCLQQSTSVNMLNTLEKEKELLRIFLDVSQNDNTALRRMNLRSFLMAPLQRVTKYPLLLSRISKVTMECHPDHGRLREAKSRVESHLEHINMKTKQEGTLTWTLRSFRRDSRKNREVINIEMREMSMKTVGWARENTRFIMEGPLQLSQPADGQWVKKGSKGLKFQNIQSLLMVRTQRPGEGLSQTDGEAKVEQQEHGVWDGVLVLIKDKSSGKFTVLREPIHLANCVVSGDPDCEDTFEVLDIRKEAFVFRASDKPRTQQWFRQIKRYTRDLGLWRKRRNALPNIMMNTNQGRS